MTREVKGIIEVHDFVNRHNPNRTGDTVLFIAISPDGDTMDYCGDLGHPMLPSYLRQLAYALEGGTDHAKDT